MTMRYGYIVAGVVAVCGSALPAQDKAPAQDAAAIAQAFGARETVTNITLSPDGKKIAFIQAIGARGSGLMIADYTAGGEPKLVMRTSGDPERLNDCDWVTAGRIICTLLVEQNTGVLPWLVSRLVAINADGSELKLVTERQTSRSLYTTGFGGGVIDWTGDGKGGVLIARVHVPETTIGTRLAKTKEGFGVDLVDTAKLSRSALEQPKLNAAEYISDGVGNVRIVGIRSPSAGGYAGDTIRYNYRKAGSRDWQPLGDLVLSGQSFTGFNPYAVDPKSDVVFGFDDANGRKALYKIALDGSLKRELVMANDRVDVDDLIRIGRQKRVVGVSWADERREAAFFDPELSRLSASLGRALPKQPAVRFVSASADEAMLVLHAGADNDAGRYYLFDKSTRKLEEVLPSRPRLAGRTLATVKPVTYPAADGTVVPGYLTLPPGSNGKGLPAIVMPHGGPSARDEWGFDWLAQFFAARGFAVLQPNYRGSAGYGESWFQKNGFQSWRTAIGDINDGGRWLTSQGIAAPGKLAIVGWSYGGYAALQSAVLDPALFKAIVAIAPVTDLDMLRNDAREYSADFPIIDRFIGSGAHVREGSPARHADRIAAPVLIVHGEHDRNVRVGHGRLMADRLRDAGKPVELLQFPRLDHQLDDSSARATMLARADAHLRKALGM